MTAEEWKSSVTKHPGSYRECKVPDYVVEKPEDRRSPIDSFYESSGKIGQAGLVFDGNPNLDFLGPLLLVGLVSSTENYYRELFSRVLSVCPVARNRAVDQAVPLGSVAWHFAARQTRGAFESLSFASRKEIISNSKKFIAFDCVGPLIKPLDEFDKICNLRHAIVHANSELPGRNAVRLGVNNARPGFTTMVNVGPAQLQEAWDICMLLVCTFNRELFETMARRWAHEWRNSHTWEPKNEHRRFKDLWQIFRSNVDGEAQRLNSLSLVRCRNKIAKEA